MEQPNLVLLFSYELLYRSTPVDRMSVYDKEDLLFHLLQEPLEEPDHDFGYEALSEYHEPQSATVADATNHITAESLARAQHDWRLTFG